MKQICKILLISLTLTLCLSSCSALLYKQDDTVMPTESDTVTFTDKQDSDPIYDRSVYYPILAKYQKAIEEKWDRTKLDENDMCMLLEYEISYDGGERLGYAFFDMNKDGTEELFIGTRYDDSGLDILDLYTVREQKVCHISGSSERHALYLTMEPNSRYKLASVSSDSAYQSNTRTYLLKSDGIYGEIIIKFDAEQDSQNPWSLGKYNMDRLVFEKIDQETALDMIKQIENKFCRPEYVPLKKIGSQEFFFENYGGG